ncbi:MAG: phosphoribosylformimino-5-aminoimidazole carboxamide ribotide isomerase [Verrucomicrobiales bacterium]|jgi:phosphoribosylformimino-5-aminoimidazole carboxamide ribotide isomerase
MTRFRPCIDLHEGRVKQIVGGTLRDDAEAGPKTNFESDQPPAHFANLYRDDQLEGGHVIKLGGGNEDAAREALASWPGGLQIGGGINPDNAETWLNAGASHVIVTSHLFDGPKFCVDRLETLAKQIGRDRLVVDLSCRRRGEGWVVATDRWQTLTDYPIESATLDEVAKHCQQLLIHAADVEGKCEGIDQRLVEVLGKWAGLPITYAGGAQSLEDLELINELSNGTVDLTIGSALDIFGGSLVRYADCVDWNRR